MVLAMLTLGRGRGLASDARAMNMTVRFASIDGSFTWWNMSQARRSVSLIRNEFSVCHGSCQGLISSAVGTVPAETVSDTAFSLPRPAGTLVVRDR